MSKDEMTGVPFPEPETSLFFRLFSLDYLRSLYCCARCGCAFIFLPVGIFYTPAMIWRFLTRRPVAVYIGNGFLSETNGYFKQKKVLKGTIWLLLHLLVIRQAHLAFARGKFLTALAEEFGAKAVTTRPLLVDVEREETRDLREANARVEVGFIGKDFVGKGLDVLFRAIQVLRRDRPQLRGTLHICGCTEAFVNRSRSDVQLAPEWTVVRHGDMLEPEELIDTIRQFDVLVVPSTTYPEGVPRVIDEAISAGVPVIASALPSIRLEYTNDEIRFFDVGDPDSLAAELGNFCARLGEWKMRPRMAGDHMRTAAEQHVSEMAKHGLLRFPSKAT